jgi:hypothetical protein
VLPVTPLITTQEILYRNQSLNGIIWEGIHGDAIIKRGALRREDQCYFCTAGEGHEKGGVEGENGYFRRNHWVPVPVARDLKELNAQLLQASREDERRVIAARTQTVGAAMKEKRSHLQPLAEGGRLGGDSLSGGQ